MYRHAVLLAVFCLAATPAMAQEGVTVTNKCCSIWDLLGVGQAAKLLDQAVLKSKLGQAAGNVLSPVGRALGLGPSLLSNKFAKEPPGSAMNLAHKLKVEEKKVPLKVQAIEYLGTLDCNCYPDVVDALLASLDDCAEEVRYAALEALNKKCKQKKHHCPLKHKHKHQGDCNLCDPCGLDNDCCGCQCQKKVVERLNELLLERDETGCLKERSARVRCLAQQMIEDCLRRRQPPPTPVEDSQEIRIDPEPALPIDPEPANTTQGKTTSRSRMLWLSRRDADAARVVSTSPTTDGQVVEVIGEAGVVHHEVGYRGLASQAAQPVDRTEVSHVADEQIVEVYPGKSERVISRTPHTPKNRRHLVGELFGY